MHHIPKTAFVLALIGSIFIILAGGLLAVVGATFSFLLGGLTWIFFVGLFVGILSLIFTILLWVRPENKTIWGVLLIVMSIASWPTAIGGFFIGFLLTLLGGIFAITYKSPVMAAPMGMPGQPGAPPAPGMACPNCGGVVNMATRTCTNCGKMVP